MTALAPLARTTFLEYDAANRVSRQVPPDGREVLFSYDAKTISHR